MSTFESRVAERKALFLERWQERVGDMAGCAEQLQKEPGRLDLLAHLNQQFHQICGPAGIYELTVVCQCAMAGEDKCIALLRAEQPLSSAQTAALRQCVQLLAAALND